MSGWATLSDRNERNTAMLMVWARARPLSRLGRVLTNSANCLARTQSGRPLINIALQDSGLGIQIQRDVERLKVSDLAECEHRECAKVQES